MTDVGARLFKGDESVGIHYWWYRKSDGECVFKDEDESISKTAFHILEAMKKKKEYVGSFKLDTKNGVRKLYLDLIGVIGAFFDDARQSNDAYDSEGTLRYKGVRLAENQNDSPPIFELVMKPYIKPVKKNGATTCLEIRVYESEPESASNSCIGHFSRVKRISNNTKRTKDFQRGRSITLDMQDRDIMDAISQYRLGERLRAW